MMEVQSILIYLMSRRRLQSFIKLNWFWLFAISFVISGCSKDEADYLKQIGRSNNENRNEINIPSIPEEWNERYDTGYGQVIYERARDLGAKNIFDSESFEKSGGRAFYDSKLIQFVEGKPAWESDTFVKPVSDSTFIVMSFAYPFKDVTTLDYEDTSKWIIFHSINTTDKFIPRITDNLDFGREKVISLSKAEAILSTWGLPTHWR